MSIDTYEVSSNGNPRDRSLEVIRQIPDGVIVTEIMIHDKFKGKSFPVEFNPTETEGCIEEILWHADKDGVNVCITATDTTCSIDFNLYLRPIDNYKLVESIKYENGQFQYIETKNFFAKLMGAATAAGGSVATTMSDIKDVFVAGASGPGEIEIDEKTEEFLGDE